MADDRVVFVLHRAMTVSRDFDRKGRGYRTGMGDALDSPSVFNVREADEREAAESEQKQKDAVDSAVERLKMKAAVERRVAELRHEAAVERRVEELRRQQQGKR
jgi:hypothetical protein